MSRCLSRSYNCPVEVTLDVIGGKWKILILWHLEERALRFAELGRRIPQISDRMLSRQLRELETDGLISRQAYAEVPPRVEYSLTECGGTLGPLIAAICDWGEAYMERITTAAGPA